MKKVDVNMIGYGYGGMPLKIKIRELLNPLILNEEWVGFIGDSEYVNEEGKLIFGYWCFHELDELANKYGKNIGGTPFKLDDSIEETAFRDKDMKFIVENDKGVVCKVGFIYPEL